VPWGNGGRFEKLKVVLVLVFHGLSNETGLISIGQDDLKRVPCECILRKPGKCEEKWQKMMVVQLFSIGQKYLENDNLKMTFFPKFKLSFLRGN